MATKRFPVTGDQDADQFLVDDPLALMIGMLLDQQIPMEWAFMAPARLRDRMGGRLDAGTIAAMDPDDVVALFKEFPALHRFPGSMAKRTQDLCQFLVDHYQGDAAKVWFRVTTGEELFRRVRELPGFGEEKARIFVALLAKRMGKRPAGWEQYAGPFADDQPRSVADISSRAAFAKVREWKKLQKAAGKGKGD